MHLCAFFFSFFLSLILPSAVVLLSSWIYTLVRLLCTAFFRYLVACSMSHMCAIILIWWSQNHQITLVHLEFCESVAFSPFACIFLFTFNRRVLYVYAKDLCRFLVRVFPLFNFFLFSHTWEMLSISNCKRVITNRDSSHFFSGKLFHFEEISMLPISLLNFLEEKYFGRLSINCWCLVHIHSRKLDFVQLYGRQSTRMRIVIWSKLMFNVQSTNACKCYFSRCIFTNWLTSMANRFHCKAQWMERT